MAAKEYAWIPQRVDESHTSVDAVTYICDANGEYAAIVGKVPKTGTLTRFEFNLGAVSNPADNGIRCSFQDPDGSGVPDGTPDQYATIASGSQAVGWMNPGDFNLTRAVTGGDDLCCVIDNPSFTAGDNFVVGCNVISTNQGIPYGLKVAGTKDGVRVPIVALHYNDGTYETLCGCEYWPAKAISSWAIQEDTTPDEIGMAFTVDVPYVLSAVAIQMTPVATGSSTFDVKLYDAANTVLASRTFDTDVASFGAPTAVRYFNVVLTGMPITLTPGGLYRVTVLPASSTTNLTMWYDTFESAAIMDALEFGSDWYGCERTGGGVWTDYNNASPDGFRRPHISLKLELPTSARARFEIGG